MRTVVLGSNAEVVTTIARRQAWGAERFDEVWGRDYHVAPFITGEQALVTGSVLVVLGQLAKAAGLIGTGALNLGAGTPRGQLHRQHVRHE